MNKLSKNSFKQKYLISNIKAQVTIFVIMALVIVAGIVIFFVIRGNLSNVAGINAELKPVFDYYDSCIEQETEIAVELAGSQGGYVSVPDYIPGSEYAPSSSQLNFLGFPVPYWYYISGNGLIKEQAPSKNDIEKEIENYLSENLRNCDFSRFYSQGYEISFNDLPDARVKIEDSSLNVEIISELIVTKENNSARRKNHEVSVKSKLGAFYQIAKEIYEKQKKDAIFDNYAVDVLRLYAPVDGVEITCSGEIWKTQDVINDLKSGLEANIASIKFNGNYYKLDNKEDEYYVIDLDEKVNENINLIYSRNMPTKIEIIGEGVDQELMIASPVGNQEGMGIMGFCYSPYHFVYDVSFPILVQIYNNEEIFQFPVIVIIDNNLAREVEGFNLEGFEYLNDENSDLCEFNTKDINVNIYDTNLNLINEKIDISYQCFDQRCRLGETDDGIFTGKAPGCLNGYLQFKGEGYTEKSELFSTNSESIADIILDREHEVDINLKISGRDLGDDTAIISFVGKENLEGRVITTALPDGGSVKLDEGLYEIIVYIYSSSGIKLGESTKTQCTDVPRSGILGFFGSTKKQCFDITIPETEIEYALAGGGKSETYILESELERGKLTLYTESLPAPRSLDDLQYNYEAFDEMEVLLEFNEN